MDALSQAVAQAEAELERERTHVWMATLDLNYDGITIFGIFGTIEGAKAACEADNKGPIAAWIADTYEERGETVHYETSGRGISYVVTRMEIKP